MIERVLSCLCLAAVCGMSGGARADPVAKTNAEMEAAIRALLVASPYRLPDAALAGTIRYRVHVSGAGWAFPETAEQHVERRGDDVELTICADCGREAPPTPSELARYREANAWVQSRDARIIGFSNGALGSSVDARMHRLVRAVRQHMSGAVDFREYQTAVQALDSRGGDCTEFAILLAAAARARGLPTRVVFGLDYASHFLGQNHAFSPHMWVQAWDGARWASYDAALGHFDAGHIALAIGDGTPEGFGDAMAVLARIRIVDAAGLLPAATETAAGTP